MALFCREIECTNRAPMSTTEYRLLKTRRLNCLSTMWRSGFIAGLASFNSMRLQRVLFYSKEQLWSNGPLVIVVWSATIKLQGGSSLSVRSRIKKPKFTRCVYAAKVFYCERKQTPWFIVILHTCVPQLNKFLAFPDGKKAWKFYQIVRL